MPLHTPGINIPLHYYCSFVCGGGGGKVGGGGISETDRRQLQYVCTHTSVLPPSFQEGLHAMKMCKTPSTRKGSVIAGCESIGLHFSPFSQPH